MKVVIAGDYCEKNRVADIIESNSNYPFFEEVKPILYNSDYAIVNFEFPIVVREASPILKCGPSLRGSVKSIDIIKHAGFNCCTLANNHTLDQGEQCGLDTKALIEKAGLDTVGFGSNSHVASKNLYKTIKGKTIAIINCCEHEFSVATTNTAGANGLNPIFQFYAIKEAKRLADYVLVIVHGGHEHFQLPSPRMVELYRFFIEVGADAVVNHHQHCYSGYEYYHGKPIVYGLGNLLFDKPEHKNDFWNYGYLAEIEFKVDSCNLTIHPYIQCSDEPVVNLLNGKEKESFFQNLQKLNITISDSNKLEQAVNKYYEECSSSESMVIEPISSRILVKLCKLNIFPKFIRGEKLYQAVNHIACESHRDKLLYALRSKMQKK